MFPVTGHSFLPPDRIFCQIEKIVRRNTSIIHPQEYHEIYSSFGNVYFINQDFKIYDFKMFSQEYQKPSSSWHFKFSQAKRLILRKRKIGVTIQGEAVYRSDLCPSESDLKKGKRLDNST